MKETLQFEGSITNPAGIEWVIGSGADVGADLYMVAPVASASAPGPSALYQIDPTTGAATILGGLGVEDPMDMAWDSSMMYLIDNDSDALYTVRQIQAPSPSAPVAPGDATGSYLPNAGDLYYNGGDFADAFMRWDNPKWSRVENCNISEDLADTDCSTYEHDLQLDRSWFEWITPVPALRDFCTTWSDLPRYYDDCPTEVPQEEYEAGDKVILSFGTFKANAIEAGRDYYGFWRFHHQTTRASNFGTSVTLLGEEGEYDRRLRNYLVCLPVSETIWCIWGINQENLVETRWDRGTSNYKIYSRP